MPGIDSFTKLILHMNSDFSDSSVTGHTPTVNGATIDTGIKKLGAGSGKFVAASSQYVSYPDHTDYNFGTNDFVIDFWVRFATVSANHVFIGKGANTNEMWRFIRNHGGGLGFEQWASGSPVITVSSATWTPNTGQWYHLAITRSVNSWRIFIDGVQSGSTLTDSGAISDNTAALKIGVDPRNTTNPHDGWIDEPRISNGTDRGWAGGFTPPTQEYTLPTIFLGQRYALTAPVLNEASLNQRYSLTGATLITSSLNQRYALGAPTLYKEVLNQRYALAGAVLTTTFLNQRYALNAPTLYTELLNQRYALIVPTGPFSLFLNQRYILNGFHIPATVYHAVTYTLTLTGAPDSVDDVVLPMTSFQTRLKDGDPSWLSVISPNSRQNADSINARPNGELVITRNGIKADGTPESIERARVELETIRTDEGSFKSSATLAGHKTTSVGTPKGISLELASLKSVYSGKIHIESKMDSSIVSGDQAEHDSQVFTVGEVFIAVNPRFTKMRITEA
jgi:hypothetical protein